jgi:hypothetical protein|tara:strand:- start:2305 stop:2484 length:180 start_codon:yes stop_codon:yes gene_type:complete
MKKLSPYTRLIAHNVKTGENVYGIISSDKITLRIDVFDGLENWVAIENDKITSRPLTYS